MAPVSTRNNPEYEYTKLNDIKDKCKVNLFGIVTDILKSNSVTKNGKSHSVLLIKDETSASFRMHVFSSTNLPVVKEGDVIRFHRVKIESYEGSLDGRVFKGQDVVVFPSTSCEDYLSLAANPTLTDEDKIRVNELKEIVALNAMFPEEEEDEPPVHAACRNEVTTGGKKVVKNKGDVEKIDDVSLYVTDDNRIVIGRPTQPCQKLKEADINHGTSPQSSHKQNFTSSRKVCQHNEEGCVINNSGEDCNVTDTNTNYRNKVGNGVLKTAVCIPNPFNPNFKFRGENTQQQIDSFIETTLPESYNQIVRRSALKRKASKVEGGPHCSKKRLQDGFVEPVLEPLQQSNCKSPDETNKRTVNIKLLAGTSPRVNTPTKGGQVQENMAEVSLTASIRTMACNAVKPISKDDPAPTKDACPGMACAMECFQQGPVLFDDNDPRLADFAEEGLVFEGKGDIPAADEKGNTICRPELLTTRGGQNTVFTNIQKLMSFQWPCNRAKVKIVAIKPRIKALTTNGPKNLLSGICYRCKNHIFYSRLPWERNRKNCIKRPLCPISSQNGQKEYLVLEFRFKITVKDAWGTELCLYGVKNHACKFLGCTPKEYQENIECRKKVTSLFSEAVSSGSFIFINFFQVTTLVKPKLFICDTNLLDALNG